MQWTSAHCLDRLATESAEEREARLWQMHDARRLASESAENREARLQQLSARRHDGLASEC